MKNEQFLLDKFLFSHPEVVLEIIDEFSPDEIAQLIETLLPKQGKDILSRMAPYKAGKVIEKLPAEHAIKIVDLTPLQVAESMLRVCEESHCEKIFIGLQSEKTKYLKNALSFENDQVGAHLEPDVLTLQEQMTFDKALDLIKESNANVKPHIFITDKKNKLIGHIVLSELIQKASDKTLKSIVKSIPKTVFAEMNAKDLLEHWEDSFIDLPVVNSDNIFLGTVSRDSLSGLLEVKRGYDKTILKTGNALGELYAIGLTGLLGGAESKWKS